MIKNISLLPPELKAEQKAKEKRQSYYLACAVLISILLLINAVLFIATVVPRMELRGITAQKEKIDREIAVLAPYADMKKQIDELEGLIKEALGIHPDWELLLNDIALSMPNGVWLTDITSTRKDNSDGVVLRGWAYSHPLVGDFLGNVQKVKGLNDVYCQFSTEADLDGKIMVQFEIIASVLPETSHPSETKGGA